MVALGERLVALGERIILLLGIVVWLCIWEFSVIGFHLNQFILPTPVAVGAQILNILSTGLVFPHTAGPPANVYSNLSITLTELVVSFMIVAAISISIGFITSESKLLDETLEPFMLTLLAIPAIVFYPVIYLILGLGPISVISYAVIAATIQTTLLMISAFKNAGRVHLTVLRSLGASRLQMLRMAKFPSVAPALLTALAYGLGTTYVVVIVGEMIASPVGMGSLIARAGSMVATSDLLALIAIVVAVIAVPIQVFAVLIRRRRI